MKSEIALFNERRTFAFIVQVRASVRKGDRQRTEVL